MAEPILLLEGVKKRFGERVVQEVLHGIDLRVYPGELTALIGPSGSGKSTLLNLIGLLDRPSEGRIWLEGTDTTRLDDDRLTRFRGEQLGFVFQFHHLLPEFTALENVILPTWARRGPPGRAVRRRGVALLEEVGLGDKVDTPVTDLSGGQQQRVAIVRALLHEPGLLLADEPTGNLDTKSASEIFALLRRANAERQMAVLVVTHDPRLAERCDRIVELVDGRIVSDHASPPG